MKKEIKDTVSQAITVAISTVIFELLRKGVELIKGIRK